MSTSSSVNAKISVSPAILAQELITRIDEFNFTDEQKAEILSRLPQKKEKKPTAFDLPLNKPTKTASIKCYLEQTPLNISEEQITQFREAVSQLTPQQQVEYMKRYLNYLHSSEELLTYLKERELCMAIMIHDKDISSSDLFEAASDKPHYHYMIWSLKNKAFRLSKLVDLIAFKPLEEDKQLFQKGNHGLEPIHNLASFAVYLTHETPDAVQDNKYQYDVNDVHLYNISLEDFLKLRETYVSTTSLGKRRTVADSELVRLDDEVRNLGYNKGSFNTWWDKKVHDTPELRREEEKFRKQYMRGFRQLLSENGGAIKIPRISLFITGASRIGKTYSLTKYFAEHQYNTQLVGKGRGSYEDVDMETQVVISDDVVPDQLQQITDGYSVKLSARFYDRYYVGDTFILVSNHDIVKTVLKNHNISQDDVSPILNRFLQIEIKTANIYDKDNKTFLSKIYDFKILYVPSYYPLDQLIRVSDILVYLGYALNHNPMNLLLHPEYMTRKLAVMDTNYYVNALLAVQAQSSYQS